MEYIKGTNIDSLCLSLLFERKLRKIGVRIKPHRELFDNTWALTWRGYDRGIINIAFYDDGRMRGVATWSCSLPSSPALPNDRKYKGKFSVLKGIPVDVFCFIKEICEKKDDMPAGGHKL
jgi:hypothetical protein